MAQIYDHIKDYFCNLAGSEIKDWSNFESIVTLKKIKKGDHFFQHLDHCDEVAIVSSGIFRIYLTDHEGEEKTFSFIPEKSFLLDFFLSWEENTNTMISVQALEDSEVYTAKYGKFMELTSSNNQWQKLFQQVLLRNYIYKTKREIQFVQFNAKERLQLFINNNRIDVNRIPKTYLASYLGIQPPSLSRLLREIKN